MNKQESISRKLRNDIFDALRIEQVLFSGVLGDVDFLSRLYDLKSLPSYDGRFDSADGDIWQHRENNFDWDNDWIFGDARFDLLGCSDENFLGFLCETVHPVVRPDADEALAIVKLYNDLLGHAGWKLEPTRLIAGRAIYVGRKVDEFHSQIDRAITAAEVLSSNWMQTEIDRMQKAVETDPALAIGTAKDLVESCCKTILAEFSDQTAVGKK